MKRLTNVILVVMAIGFSSCLGFMRPQSAAGKTVLSFYRGPDSLMHFVKTMKFENDEKERIEMDFTYHHNKGNRSWVVTNFSVIDTFRNHDYGRLKFTIENDSLVFENVDTMYSKKEKKNYLHRYSFEMKDSEFKKLLKARPEIEFDSRSFIPQNWNEKSFEVMNEVEFDE